MNSPFGERSDFIARYIHEFGLKRLAEAMDVNQWAVQKWRRGGYVPNARLEEFCRLTGARPAEVCDPSLDFIFNCRREGNTTKRSTFVKTV